MSFFLIHAQSRDQASEIRADLETNIARRCRGCGVYTAIVPEKILEARGVRSLPAILWVEAWPDDFLILYQGATPTLEEMESWLVRYDLVARPTSQIVGATVFGTITDRSSGLPLIGATVSLSPLPIASGPFQVDTNRDGDYALDVIHPGILNLHFYFGREPRAQAKRQVLVRKGKDLRLDMQLDGRTAGDQPYRVIDGTFTGLFTPAFEAITFRADAGSIVDESGNPMDVRDAWVEFETPEWDNPFEENKNYRVEWVGRLCGPGSYGHFGGSRFLMLVEGIKGFAEALR
jgi:hypothetical protein